MAGTIQGSKRHGQPAPVINGCGRPLYAGNCKVAGHLLQVKCSKLLAGKRQWSAPNTGVKSMASRLLSCNGYGRPFVLDTAKWPAIHYMERAL
jgi:hypothetical protein